MREKIIYLGSVDPMSVYGVNNSRLEKIRNYFPKLKIIARGSEIKVIGDEEQIREFEKKMQWL